MHHRILSFWAGENPNARKSFTQMGTFLMALGLAIGVFNTSHAADVPEGATPAEAPQAAPTEVTPAELAARAQEDAVREKAIAEFTQKMKEANYPALFE